jgi:hypothetical protein
MRRLICASLAFAIAVPGGLNAQTLNINDLKGRIFDAKMAEKIFAKGLKYCKQLDGKTTFYFAQRDRLLNLDDYNRSLQNLVTQRMYNPETRRPWTEEDAKARWAAVQKQAAEDKKNCELVANLPRYEQELAGLEKK